MHYVTTPLFLTGKKPSREVPYGSYPLIVHPMAKPKKSVLVVQDYTFGKYLGHLNVKFNNLGEVTHYDGNPILLNGSYERDPAVLAEVKKRLTKVQRYSVCDNDFVFIIMYM